MNIFTFFVEIAYGVPVLESNNINKNFYDPQKNSQTLTYRPTIGKHDLKKEGSLITMPASMEKPVIVFTITVEDEKNRITKCIAAKNNAKITLFE